MRLEDFKKQLLKKSEFKKEYYKYDLAFEIGQILLEARVIKGITQAKLAEMIHTKQSGIARVESGKYLPSLRFLKKIADAFNTCLLAPRFAFMETEGVKIRHKATRTKREDKKIRLMKTPLPFFNSNSARASEQSPAYRYAQRGI